jgi:hypothetical protein
VICCLMCVVDCDLLLGVCHGLSIMVSWLPCCCMDCDLLLDVCHGLCIMVSWSPCCCMDCDVLLGVRYGLFIMFSCCVAAWIVMLFDGFMSWIVHHGFPESHGL